MLNTASYTVIVLVAITTSVMAPPLLRWAMRRVTQTEEELARLATQQAWAGGPVDAAPDRKD